MVGSAAQLAAYLLRCVRSPRTWPRLRRAIDLIVFVPCPACLATLHPVDSRVGDTVCLFCPTEVVRRHAPAGFVSLEYWRRGWDWRRWCPAPGYPGNALRTGELFQQE
jgi:hypothetical protein